MNFQLWCCEPEFLRHYLETTLNVSAEVVASLDSLRVEEPDGIFSVNGEEAVIRIEGVLTKAPLPLIAKLFGFRGTTYGEIADAAKRAAGDPDITRVRLVMDTPGGEAVGVDEAAQAIAVLEADKEVIAENRGMIASAGYWIASQATRIEAADPIALTGSIGVIVAGWDTSEAEKNNGVRRVKIISKNAPNKAADLASETGRAEIQRTVDAIERAFINRVAAGRLVTEEKVKTDYGRGGVLIALDPDKEKPDALSAGLIDAVSTDFRNAETEGSEEIPAANTPAVESDKGRHRSEIGRSDKSNKTKEKKVMSIDLKLVIEENPGLAEVIDKIKSDARAAGIAEVREAFAKASPILKSDSYPETIKKLASDAVSGEIAIETLQGTVAAYDTVIEAEKSKNAKDGAKATGDTPPNDIPEASSDGTVSNEADYQAMIAQSKGGN